MEREEAIASMHRLAGLMQLQGKSDHARRLHVRATLAEVTAKPDFAPVPRNDIDMEAMFGVQIEVRDERILPPAVASLVSLAELHGARGQHDEAIRVMERVIGLEERRVGPLDERLAPHLVALAQYVELSGNLHEASSIKQRAFSISDAARPAIVDGQGWDRKKGKSLRELQASPPSGVHNSPSRGSPGNRR